MTIDPRVGMWLSIVLAILGVAAGSTDQLKVIFGEHTETIILAWIVLVMGVGNAINAVLHAIPSQSGPTAAAEFPLGPKK